MNFELIFKIGKHVLLAPAYLLGALLILSPFIAFFVVGSIEVKKQKGIIQKILTIIGILFAIFFFGLATYWVSQSSWGPSFGF